MKKLIFFLIFICIFTASMFADPDSTEVYRTQYLHGNIFPHPDSAGVLVFGADTLHWQAGHFDSVFGDYIKAKTVVIIDSTTSGTPHFILKITGTNIGAGPTYGIYTLLNYDGAGGNRTAIWGLARDTVSGTWATGVEGAAETLAGKWPLLAGGKFWAKICGENKHYGAYGSAVADNDSDCVGIYGVSDQAGAGREIGIHGKGNIGVYSEGDMKIHNGYSFDAGYAVVSKIVAHDSTSPVSIVACYDGWIVVDVWCEVIEISGTRTFDVGDTDNTDDFLATAKIDEGTLGYYGLEADDRGDYLWDVSNSHIRQKIYSSLKNVIVTIGGTGTSGEIVVSVGIKRLK